MNYSKELFAQARQMVPGGVHSPVRSFQGVDMNPLFMQTGRGAYLYDTEDKRYIDFCMGFGPFIHGHADSDIEKAFTLRSVRGLGFGACEPWSNQLVEFVVEAVPGIEQVRLVNSGTEAVMSALRVARGHTGKDKIVKFNGCYHGHCDSMLIRAGSGLAGSAEASSAGVPQGVANDTLIVELDDLEALSECFAAHKGEIAAVIVEPLPANNGLLIQRREFLEGLRQITREESALLIFDEVISGFRVGPAGMIGETNIVPDLVTYGKIIGGGMPVGALAGPASIMKNLAPEGRVYQAGTLSANLPAVAAGLAGLSKLTPESYQTLADYSQAIVDIFQKWLREYDSGRFADFQVVAHGSLFWFAPRTGIRKACDIPQDLSEKFTPLFQTLLAKGVYLAPSPYEVGFISLAHDELIAENLQDRLWGER